MNKAILLLIPIIFLAGCTQQPDLGKGGTSYDVYPIHNPPKDHSYFQDVQSPTSYIGYNENAVINFRIVNPTRQASEHRVEVKYDLSNCFGNAFSPDISVQANDDTASSIRISVFLSDDKCLGTRTVTLLLKDKNDVLVDYANILFIIKK